MERTYWHKQTAEEPLFPDLLWDKPENKALAGKLLIIGGNLHGFSAAASSYQFSQRAGAGSVRVLLPDALKKTVGKILEAGEYAPSTPSGSFARQALGTLLEHASWADGVLLAGDLGRNSETAVLVESFLQKYSGQVTLTKDAVDYVSSGVVGATIRPNTTFVTAMPQLQRLLTAVKWPKAVTLDMPLLNLVDILHELTTELPVCIVVKQLHNILVACGGQVSTSKQENDTESWRVQTATGAVVWWMQNPGKPFEAITTSLYEQRDHP